MKGDRTYSNVAYPCKQKFMNYTVPQLSVDVALAEGGYDVTLESDVFARAVFLSLDGIDNFSPTIISTSFRAGNAPSA